jgi:hypothetical protein
MRFSSLAGLAAVVLLGAGLRAQCARYSVGGQKPIATFNPSTFVWQIDTNHNFVFNAGDATSRQGSSCRW